MCSGGHGVYSGIGKATAGFMKPSSSGGGVPEVVFWGDIGSSVMGDMERWVRWKGHSLHRQAEQRDTPAHLRWSTEREHRTASCSKNTGWCDMLSWCNKRYWAPALQFPTGACSSSWGWPLVSLFRGAAVTAPEQPGQEAGPALATVILEVIRREPKAPKGMQFSGEPYSLLHIRRCGPGEDGSKGLPWEASVSARTILTASV